jgi:hypothetical protein
LFPARVRTWKQSIPSSSTTTATVGEAIGAPARERLIRETRIFSIALNVPASFEAMVRAVTPL